MVLCIAAMVIFGLMAIFSARYRPLAKETFRCTFNLIRFRPCDTNFDQRIKSKVTAKLLIKFPKFANVVYKYFKALSMAFVLIFFLSLGYSSYSIYNLAVYNDCNPADLDSQCFFNPSQTTCSPSDIPEDIICLDLECTNTSHKKLNGRPDIEALIDKSENQNQSETILDKYCIVVNPEGVPYRALDVHPSKLKNNTNYVLYQRNWKTWLCEVD